MEYITQIQEIARLAGAEAMKYFNHIKENAVSCKGTPKDIVSTADKAVETLIASEIQKRFPGHGMYGEEYGRRGQESPFCWVVDPIDGTQSFVHGHPFFCISIALKENGTTIAGCVFAPRLNMMFSAERGKGAFEDGRPIHVSGCDKLSSAVVATGFACLRAGLKKNN
ncbi:MAG: inositol monophosphatase, partial [Lentisphaeria bacterium]|nr:inositol monophosphatase [Lentisphaeria bacterium]